MRRIALWSAATVAAVGLLLGYHTSTEGVPRSRSTATAGIVSSSTSAAPTPGPTDHASSRTGAPRTAGHRTAAVAKAATVVVNGAAAPTPYGDVQVQLTVVAGKVVKAVAIAYSQGGRDGEINAQAIPVLQAETVKAGGARIDSVSGATFTSQGYRTSLQSALDAAGL